MAKRERSNHGNTPHRHFLFANALKKRHIRHTLPREKPPHNTTPR